MLKGWFILWWTLLQFLFQVGNSQVPFFQPQERIFHTATYIDNKLYVFGGESTSTNPEINEITLKEFFYLDCSEKFSTIKLPWHYLSNTGAPSRWAAAAARGGVNNSTMFLYGGFSSPKDDLNLVYTYETQNGLWNIPDVNGGNTTVKRSLEAVTDYNDNMYLFGGSSDEFGISNSMIILDTFNLAWKVGSLINAPAPRFYYGATLLPNQNIIYFGGNDGKEILGLDVVYLYDTINNIWNENKTSGLIPSKRYLFSTVLGLDGIGVIVFGGFGVSYTDSLYELNTINFEWYIPKVSGKLPGNRYNHKANVIGNFMIVSFGFGYQRVESDILLLDMTNKEEYIWSIIFIPTSDKLPSSTSSISTSTPTTTAQTNSPASSQQSDSSNNKMVLIAAIIIVSILILLACLFI